VSMGGRLEGLACADPGARTPIGASGNFFNCLVLLCSSVWHCCAQVSVTSVLKWLLLLCSSVWHWCPQVPCIHWIFKVSNIKYNFVFNFPNFSKHHSIIYSMKYCRICYFFLPRLVLWGRRAMGVNMQQLSGLWWEDAYKYVLWLADTVHEGYLAWALIGQHKFTGPSVQYKYLGYKRIL
jgi:hypothetical protein